MSLKGTRGTQMPLHFEQVTTGAITIAAVRRQSTPGIRITR